MITMLREIWYEQVTGTLDEAVAVVTGGTAPTQTDVLDDSGWPGDDGSNYVSKLSGFVVVPADGDYTFYISGDDHCGLWVSQDTTEVDPLVEAPVAFVDGWSNWLDWTANESQKAEPMTLAADVGTHQLATPPAPGGGSGGCMNKSGQAT